MRKRFAGGFLLIALVCLAVLGMGAEFPVEVKGVRVEGLVEIQEKDVLDVVGFKVGDEVTESDLKAASQAIYDLGWFSEVAPHVGDGEIVFRVTENPVVHEIEIKGNVNKRSYEMFGIKLFELPIMPTSKIKQILRQDGVKKGKVLNRTSLKTALNDVISEYNKRGYILVAVGDVVTGETLSIEFVEALVAGNRVEGLDTVPASVVEGMIDLPLNEPLRQSDLQRVLLRLRGSVYFSDVDVVPKAGPRADSVILSWKLTERHLIDEPVTVRKIDLEGVTRFPAEVAYAALGDIPAEPLDNYGLLRVLSGLYNLYHGSGYIMVRFSVLGVDDGDLRLGVQEGEIARILISGNTRTHDYVIRRNLKLGIGQILTQHDLQVAYQKLNSLRYFGSVNVLPEWGDDGVRVSVVVTEKEHLGGMNGSLALEPSTGGIVGQLTVDQRNLWGTGQDISLSYSRGLVETEPTRSTWDLGYSTVAYFPGFDRVGVDLYRELKETDDGTYMTLGGSVSFDYPLADYTDLSISYKHEDERLMDSEQWTPTDSIGASVIYDSVDDPYFPTGGDRRIMSVEKAGGFAAGREYTKIDATWIHFSPVYSALFEGKKKVFGIRFKAGWSEGDLPVTGPYKLGGPMTVRGVTGESVARIVIANFEGRIQLIEGLALVAFFDAGFDLDSVCLEDGLASTGLELGINAASMYFRLDFIWVIGPDMNWIPRFDVGFGPMF